MLTKNSIKQCMVCEYSTGFYSGHFIYCSKNPGKPRRITVTTLALCTMHNWQEIALYPIDASKLSYLKAAIGLEEVLPPEPYKRPKYIIKTKREKVYD